MKNKTFAFRIRERDLNAVRRNADMAKMTVTDYVTACALGKEIVIVDGLPELVSGLKALGNNLNQLTVLANMGRVTVVDLTPFTDGLGDMHAALRRILEVV